MGKKMKFFALISIAFACGKGKGKGKPKKPSCSKAKLYCPDGSQMEFSRDRKDYTDFAGSWKKKSYCKIRKSVQEIYETMRDKCPKPRECSQSKWDKDMVSWPVCIDSRFWNPDKIGD